MYIYNYRIALNFCRSLILRILRIFNCLRKYFNNNFWHAFSCSDCKNVDGQHPWTELPIHKNTLQEDTFEVGIALLTAASLRGRVMVRSVFDKLVRLVCHTHSILCVQRVHVVNLYYFNEIFKYRYSRKLRPSKIYRYTVYTEVQLE